MAQTPLILAEDAGPAPVALLQHGGGDAKILAAIREQQAEKAAQEAAVSKEA